MSRFMAGAIFRVLFMKAIIERGPSAVNMIESLDVKAGCGSQGTLAKYFAPRAKNDLPTPPPFL